MWKAQRRTIRENWGETLSLSKDGRALTVADVLAGWRDDAPFCDFFIAELAATSFPAFFWEMPPLMRTTLADPFECAVIRGDALVRMRADDADFAGHLRGPELVVAFPNLGRDALLIAPCRMSDADDYGHVAAFLRLAPREQRRALFRSLALEIEKRLAASQDRFWISTSGLGVPWVHVRLDTYPKYYQYGRYARGL
jgi:hypothetical protein